MRSLRQGNPNYSAKFQIGSIFTESELVFLPVFSASGLFQSSSDCDPLASTRTGMFGLWRKVCSNHLCNHILIVCSGSAQLISAKPFSSFAATAEGFSDC